MGSGKTTVAGLFAQLGIPIYDADDRAKTLMVQDSGLRESIVSLLGSTAYLPDGSLNREALAAKVFKDPRLLQELNALVHPVVAQDSLVWAELVNSKRISTGNASCDFGSGSPAHANGSGTPSQWLDR
jgi:dephospho-CoA kinase